MHIHKHMRSFISIRIPKGVFIRHSSSQVRFTPTHTRCKTEDMSFFEYISYIYQKRFGPQKLPLGRWSLVEGDKVFHRSERANEDHCGACGDLYKNNDTK